jgi:hypothetical protein
MRNCKCGNQVADNAKACPKCGHRFTGAFTKFVAWIFAGSFGLIVLLIYIGSLFDTPSAAPTPLQTPAQPYPLQPPTAGETKSKALTPAEKVYFGAALSYLKTANSQGTKLATTMAGASDGSSTLGDIKSALSSAKRIENTGYVGDYYERINRNVPESCKEISKDVDEVHRLFQSGIKETLEYWEDQDTDHIVSGNAAIQRSAVLMNATINKTGEKMKERSKGK